MTIIKKILIKTLFLNIFLISCFFAQTSHSQEIYKGGDFTGNKFNSIMLDDIDSSLVWCGTSSGILQYNRKKNVWSYIKSTLNNINTITTDPNDKDLVWIGTENGINKYSRTSKKIELIRIELKTKLQDTTLNKNFDTTNKFDSTTLLTNLYKVNTMVLDTINKDKFWIGTQNGLLKYDYKSNKWFEFSKKDGLLDISINTIAVDKINSNLIWIGTDRGINVLSREKEKIDMLPLPDNKENAVYNITVDGMYLLVGTSNGIQIYNKNDKTWKFYSSDSNNLNVPNDKILSIEIDKNRPSYVWFGTAKNGIYGYDKLADLWQKFDSQQNVRVSYLISDIIEKDTLWGTVNVCSGGGLIKYDRSSNNWYITEPLINLLGDLEFIWKELK